MGKAFAENSVSQYREVKREWARGFFLTYCLVFTVSEGAAQDCGGDIINSLTQPPPQILQLQYQAARPTVRYGAIVAWLLWE